MNTLCTWCGSDMYVDEHDEINDIAYCTGPGHLEPRMFEPNKEHAAWAKNGRSDSGGGIASELDLYNDLPLLLNQGEWAETGVVEYRYGIAHPEKYKWMLRRWGNVAEGPRKFSTTSFIGSTLGQLSRATNVRHKPGPGTGLFAHNAEVGYWTLEPVPATTVDLSWEACAIGLEVDPKGWPLL